MRLSLFLTALTMLLLTALNPAKAGDFANREILGFSKDGGLFAFEEYGVQDGSGFPYSTIYLIDTKTDNWVSGSPYSTHIDNENASVEKVREKARQMAGSALSPISDKGIINATNQPLEVVDNPQRMEARPWPFNPPTADRIEFRIDDYEIYDDLACKDFGGTKGFRLTQIFKEPGKATRVLHEDSSVPNSRSCPHSYRFADIVSFQPEGQQTLILAILILYERFGFEGPDGRYLAVTTNMPIE